MSTFLDENIRMCVVCGKPVDHNSIVNDFFCTSCLCASEEQQKRFSKIDSDYRSDFFNYKNKLMSSKNMFRLFMVNLSGRGDYDSYRIDLYINLVTGIPYIQSWHSGSPTYPCQVDVSEIDPISFYQLIRWAKSNSESMHEKYKGISEENWIEYLIDEI